MPASGKVAAGTPGPANSLTVGTVSEGAANATITGTSPNQVLNLAIPKGNTGPSSKVALGTINIGQTALVLINAGVRTLTFTGVSGVLKDDDIILFPISTLPAGYAIHNSIATANGTLEVTFNGPLLALGASFSVPCRVVALR